MKNIPINKTEFVLRFDKLFTVIFLGFIFLTLSFGRAFSIINIKGVFVTEIVLFFGLFYILFHLKDIFKMPRSLLACLFIYFILGCAYFLNGCLEGRIYVLRDIVFFAYTLFFPITFLVFSNKQLLKRFLLILIVSNIFGLVFARATIFVRYPPWLTLQIFNLIKAFNYLLYFGMTISFLISSFYFVKEKKYKVLIILLCVFNVYISIVWGERSSWAALFALFLFFVLVFKAKFLKFSFYFFTIFLVISIVFLSFFDKTKKGPLLNKSISLSFYLKKITAKAPKDNIVPKDNKAPKEEALSGKQKNIRPELPSDKTKLTKAESSVELLDSAKDEFSEGHDSLFYFSNLLFRIEMWKTAMQRGFESPVVGEGFGRLLIPPKPWRTSEVGVRSGIIAAHNHVLSIFYKMGLSGLALFLFINVYSFLYGFRYLKQAKNDFTKLFLIGCLGSLVCWHMQALLFDVIESPPTSIFLWIITGLIFACVQADYEK